MKKVWFLGLLAAAFLAGCSDNDDNGDEVKPGGGQVESPYLPQRIAQVKVVKDGEESDSVCYYYDTRGRVSMFVNKWKYYATGDMFKYFEDYSIESDEYVYHILSGKVVAMYQLLGDLENKPNEVKYAYDGDCLQSLRVINSNYRDVFDTLMIDFSFLKDNLERYTMDKNDNRFQVVFEYGNYANVLNIDMFYFLMRYVFYDLSGGVFWEDDYRGKEDYFNSWLLGIAGERSACLPESMEVTMPRESGNGEETRAYTCKYTMKGEYVSEMAILDAAGKEAYRFVFTYEE